MARTIIAGNWKMNHGPRETREFVAGMKEKYQTPPAVETVICPPFVSISDLVNESPEWLKTGAQNVYFEESGAFTGEVSPKMLAELGVEYVIIGHSERRNIFAESDEEVNKKVRIALKYGIKPIICVGESDAQRNEGKTLEVVENQVKSALSEVVSDTLQNVVFAYEPVWAIGSGKAATGEDAEQVCKHIRSVISELNSSVADDIPVLYGGSVKPENLEEFMDQDNINGALVGGKSLVAETYCQLLEVARRFPGDEG
ncbi:triose-phosphate isomerase [Natranaerobius thermophilus]|uniref:Triosephosphate isomerase n=1 Tax=Natranaerobius thermophilus (strain ATCC BAA-1301 / DSM 18059 / JW/NM-WN-LF) TaxID=457570 RepID=TPIS_NATTJ|nr:triose-phosphate isomerase [Natranaerobius thermophilus]B2A6Z3.1 RecName: Full=Triosephosphate isomerase; Short=TIM; Short=TPI; AltName: Full=Triose-phosphate isomerase [Natranaerobius thermophilus JW/NM-WN-LF]ACB85584.1 triosephosphate isomerase [Natranaerobius thermophilus JW/NM-WN-LF]